MLGEGWDVTEIERMEEAIREREIELERGKGRGKGRRGRVLQLRREGV